LHGDFEGRILGRKVAMKAWAKAQTYFDGSAEKPQRERSRFSRRP
jgi:hypothetical protein